MQTLVFLVVTFLFTWACYGPVAAGWLPIRTPAGRGLILLGTFGPGIVAIALTAMSQGVTGLRALISRIAPTRLDSRWWLFALFYFLAIKLAAAGVDRVLTGDWPRFQPAVLLVFPFALLLSTPVQAGEEIGWRGYALPRMAARLGLGGAAILLGVVWALWHLPLFFVRDADTHGQSFLVYTVQVVAISVAIAFLYGHARGRLLPVMLLHAAINNSKDFIPSGIPGATHTFTWQASSMSWIGAALLWVCAAGFLIRMPAPPRADDGD
jgi:membrane protease YdiL (CAAX protease family)